MTLKEVLEKVKTFILFDVRWMLFHILVQPVVFIVDLVKGFFQGAVDATKPKDFMQVSFIVFIVALVAEKGDIMLTSGVLVIISYLFYLYYSKEYIYTMRRYNERKIGGKYGHKRYRDSE